MVRLLLRDSCREAIAVRAVRRLGFRRAAASDDPRLRRVSCIDRGCAAALPESFSFPIVGSCRPCRPRRFCRGLGRMLGRHRERERCGAGQSLTTSPGHRTRTSRSRGPNSRALSGILASGSTPAPEADGVRDGTPVQLQAGGRSFSAGPATAGRCTVRRRAVRGPGPIGHQDDRQGAFGGDCPGRRARAARERPLRARFFPDWAGIGCSRPKIQTAARLIHAPYFTPLTVWDRSSPG